MLKIYGRNNSSNVQKVIWTINEIGIKFEQLNVGGEFGGINNPAYLAKNPNSPPTFNCSNLIPISLIVQITFCTLDELFLP